MFTLSSQTRVEELAVHSPAMLAALQSTGLFRDGDDPAATLDDLCYGFGLNPAVVLNVLARARAEQRADDFDVSAFDGWTMTAVIEHIEREHHDYVRRSAPVITQQLEGVVAKFGGRDERLAELRTFFQSMTDELEQHLQHEEEALFPMVRDIEKDGAVRPTRCGDSVGGPIACMENDHVGALRQLETLRALTDRYTPPEHADDAYRQLLERLAGFDANLVAHIHTEDRVLFPGAQRAQSALPGRI